MNFTVANKGFDKLIKIIIKSIIQIMAFFGTTLTNKIK